MNAPELDIGPLPETFRIFVAHSKADDPGKLDDMKAQIESILNSAAKEKGLHRRYKAVLGREDFEIHFKRCGSWDGWAADVVTRVDYATRAFVYAAIVITNRNVGRATYVTAVTALSARKPVYLFENGRILRVTGIETIDGHDFKMGWEVQA